MTEQEMLIIGMFSDLSYAQGKINGLGHESKYLADRLMFYKGKIAEMNKKEAPENTRPS